MERLRKRLQVVVKILFIHQRLLCLYFISNSFNLVGEKTSKVVQHFQHILQ